MRPPVQRHVVGLTTNYPTVSVQSVNSLNIPCTGGVDRPARPVCSTYAGEVSPEPHSAPVPSAHTFLSDRIRGCLLGGAFGDAAAHAHPEAAGLSITADTQLALYSMDGLQEAIEWANEGLGADETACIWLAYLRWLGSRGLPLPEAGLVPQPRPIDAEPLLRDSSGAPEASLDPEVLAALSTGEMGTRQRPVNTAGSSPAPLVRSAPFGLLPYVGTETVYKLSLDAASLTHGHPAARHAAAVFASMVHGLLVSGATLRDAAVAAVERAGQVPADDGGAPGLVDRLRAVLSSGADDAGETADGNAARTRTATAEDALAAGLQAALEVADRTGGERTGGEGTAADKGQEGSAGLTAAAVRRAAEKGGAPAAVVAGSLLGTLYGPEALPEAEALREYGVIEKLTAAFVAATIAP